MNTDLRASGTRPRDRIGLGIGLAIAAIVTFGIQDAVAKVLVQTHSPFQIVMMRYWAFAAFSLWLVSRYGGVRKALASRAPWLQVSRGLLLVVDIWLFAFAVGVVPLAELQAIVMIYPLLVTLFAIPLLGERVGLFRFAAVTIGFAGALVIVRPGGLAIEWGVLSGAMSAACYALYIVITRRVAAYDTTATNMLYVGLVGLVLTTAIGIWYWQPMDVPTLLLTLVVMATTCLGHGAMMLALSYAPASLLQPFNYLALPWAITLSFVIFAHLIDPISLIGAGIIVAAGLVVTARERLLGKSKVIADGTTLPGKE